MKYRREVDGLRALAVVPVILFHAGFEVFSGGFVGVDVFFVISGYLITSLILAEQQAGTFTLADFYERRARRILPALFLVMAACVPFSWLWLLPADMKSFTSSLAAVALFVSNIFFQNQSGYFDTAAELKPLLHTWSLAVEEQYYLLFPLFLVVGWRFGHRFIVTTLAVLFVLSFGFAHWMSQVKAASAFFLSPTRGWELLLGAFLGFHLARPRHWEPPRAIAESGALAGLFLLAYSIFAFDARVPFPSLYTLAPTVGTALLILFATPQTQVGRLLGNKVLVGLGLVSYSAYLWHQPLLAFARHRMMEAPSPWLLGLLASSSLVLAFLSWRYVEAPFRDRKRFGRRTVWTCAAAGSAFFIAIAWAGYATKGFDHRLTAKQREILRYGQPVYTDAVLQDVYRLGKCFLQPEQDASAFAPGCQGAAVSADSAFLWGDSHAAALLHGWRQRFPQVSQYNASGCPPLPEASLAARPHCTQVNAHVLRKLAELAPAKVFLHANWSAYAELDPVHNLPKTLRAIRAALPRAEVIVVGPVPRWNPSLPVFLLRRRLDLDGEHLVTNPALGELRDLDAALREQATRHGARYLSPLQALCRETQCVATVSYRGVISPVAWDEAHLTEAGSALLAQRLLAQLR